MKNTVNSPFKSMTKEQQKAFFEADADTNMYGKCEIEKDRKVLVEKVEKKKDTKKVA